VGLATRPRARRYSATSQPPSPSGMKNSSSG
jgi:hypothetical protein